MFEVGIFYVFLKEVSMEDYFLQRIKHFKR